MRRAARPGLRLAVALTVLIVVGALAEVAGPPGVRDAGDSSAVTTPASADRATEPASVDVPLAEVAPVTAVPSSLAVVSDARWSLAVRDVTTGHQVTWGDPGTFTTASVVKVDVLLAVLLQAQDAGRALSPAQTALATAMITRSDNDATNALIAGVGGVGALQAVHERLGVRDVQAASTWGLTRTTAAAQLDVVAVVTGDRPGLDEPYRAIAQQLMRTVVAEQRFGVTAAADDPGSALVKVGYLPRTRTGRWDVTSVGAVEHGGRPYLVSVLTEGSTSREAGIALTEQLATAGVAALSQAVAR